MSLKRKFEEYHDPDYPQQQATTTKQSKPNVSTNEERCQKIRSIVHREFEKELQHKEDELQQIDHKLQESKRLLQRVRYAIVANFYRKQNLEYTERELQHQLRDRHSSTDTQASMANQLPGSNGNKLATQTTVHPSLKKLLGKHPIDYNEILKIRPARQAAKTAKTTISQKLRSKRDERKLRPPEAITIREDVKPKVPRYVSPIKLKQHFEKLTSARGRNNFRHLLAVGNTSKYIGDEKSLDGVTHKWLVYVKTHSSDVDIADIVSEVRFFLHPSYSPNDVVKVDCPPFHLSRRGWGEFPIRLQLYFHPHIQQKPLQIIHNLVLDKRLTGLQTMGAETIVELYLNIPNAKKQELFNDEESITSDNVKETETNNQMMKVVFKHEPPIDLPTTILQEHEYYNSSSSASLLTENRHVSMTEHTQSQIDLPAIIMQGHESPVKEKQHVLGTEQNHHPMQEHEYNNSSSSSLTDSHHVQVTESIAKTIKQEKDYVQPIPNHVVQPITTNIVTTQPIVKNISIQQKPNFVKCLDSNGKVIIVQLVTDPNNPKNIKIIKNPKLNLSANNLNPPSNSTASPMVSLPTTVPKTIQIVNSLNNQLVKPNISTKNVLNVPQIQKKVILSSLKPSSLSTANEQQKLPASTTTNKKTIIVKNGQIFVLHNTTDGSVKNLNRPIVIQKTKQESLLKPQISLLKTNFNKPSVTTATTIATSRPIYQNQASIQNLIKNKCKPLPPITYEKRLETLFLQNNQLNTIKQAVTMLLKHVPLFSHKLPTNDVNFRAEFPFICNSETTFMSLSSEQKKCSEWYRAKYIQKFCKKHKKFQHFTNEMWWSTKEILLYARRIGYTPTILMDNLQTNKIELKKIIQREIKQEQLKNVDTLTLKRMVNNWITKRENEKLNQNDVDDDNIDNLVINIDECDNNKSKKDIRNKSTNDQQMQRKNTVWLPLDSNILKESAWVSDLCRDIQITLLPEEICQGVMHLSAQRTLIQALHSFIEDLLRQALYNKNVNTERIDSTVGSEDIRKVVSKINRFDFCTNKYLGIKSINQ